MNKFKKSTLTTAIALVLCFTTLVVTALAATQNLSSYERFKNALLHLPSIENATISGSVKLLDNDVETLSADISAKIQDHSTMSSKASVTVNDETFTEEQWSNSEQTVTKSSDSEKYRVSKSFQAISRDVARATATTDENGVTVSVFGESSGLYTSYVYTPNTEGESVAYSYNAVGIGGENQTFDDFTVAEQKLIHAAVDLVVGDVKNYFTANGNTITLNLDKNQIPQIAQLVVSVLAEKSSMMRDQSDKYHSVGISAGNTHSTALVDLFPKLTEDTSIQSGNLNVTFDDNGNITAIKGVATVVGTDVDGVSHTLTLDVDLAITDIGTTVADTIDLTGKEVIENTNMFESMIIGDSVEIKKFTNEDENED